MKKLAILHYMPLEYYPPVTNLIDYLTNYHIDRFTEIKVYSNTNVSNRKEYEVINNVKSLTIFRSKFPKTSDKNLMRMFKYLYFNLYTLLSLVKNQPDKLIYFESYSAWPVYIYTKNFNKNCKVFIHCHEYFPKQWYQKNMKQVKYFHKLEKKLLYKKATWISQTNETRLKLFHNDHPYIKSEVLKIMPNYPPRSWQSQIANRKSQIANQTSQRLVYIGSLSLKNTYIKELCEWVIQQNGEVLFDIYSYNLDNETLTFLNNLKSDFISFFKNGIEYNNIPKVLGNYNVGVILYKPFSLNYINNVTNKFYEYYACGLDIWFSKSMKSTYQHISPETYPRVIPIDFTRLKYFNWQKAANKKGLQKNDETFYCEDVYEKLVEELVK